MRKGSWRGLRVGHGAWHGEMGCEGRVSCIHVVAAKAAGNGAFDRYEGISVRFQQNEFAFYCTSAVTTCWGAEA